MISGSPHRIDGHVAARFEKVKDAFGENFTDRGELGAAVTVVIHGEIVVDLRGGWTDPGRHRRWTPRTLTNLSSATNGLTALCVLQLVESGDLDLDAPVARYWPEFGAAGKAEIPVRWLLSHRSGVTGVGPEHRLKASDLFDWPKMAGLIAAQQPFFEPGSTSGFQLLSYGFMAGEIIRRVTGQTTGEFLLANIARPLNADVHIGLDVRDLDRCSTILEPREGPGERPCWALSAPPGIATTAALANPVPFGRYANEPSWRLAELPAANGHATSHGLATVYGALADGSERLLTRETIESARTSQGLCVDAVVGADNEFGLGLALGSVQHSFGPNPRAFGHDGMGGATGFADPEQGLGFAYVMNQMGSGLRDDPRKMALVKATYDCLA